MADLLTTLHPINDENTDLYPNVKRDNLPQNVKDELDAIPNKVDKVQGKGLSTNDFTNADKALVDTIPDKVDKVTGKGLSTNDYTNADKLLVDSIPDKVDKVQGKGLSTNDYTNVDKNAVEVVIPLRLSFLNTNILNLYRMVIRSGGMITVTDASVALTSQTFPLTVSPKALLNHVGGMCQKVGDSIITAPVTTVVSKGSTDIYYPIHRDIRALDGYGWGINADCYNYIDFERKVFVKKVARVDLGSLDWEYNVNGVFRSLSDPSMGLVVNPQNALCDKYTFNGSANDSTISAIASNLSDKQICGYSNAPNANRLVVKDSSAGTDATSFKQAVQGVYIYYELATPVETNISDLLVLTFPTYDIINVIAGGYLEFENENDIGVPYSVTYQYKPDAPTTVQTIAPTAISEVDSNDPTDAI